MEQQQSKRRWVLGAVSSGRGTVALLLAFLLWSGLTRVSAAETDDVEANAAIAVRTADPALNPGFAAFFSNQYDQAIAYFEAELKKNPRDAGQYNHLAQAILYRELYLNGALESQLVSGNNAFLRREKIHMNPAEHTRLMKCLSEAEEISEQRVNSNSRDARAWYELGVTHGLRANYCFLIEKAWTESLRQATAARKADERALEIDPNFTDANLIPGLYQYVVGSLPFFLRTMSFIGGFHGDRQEGIRKLELVATKGKLNKYDAQVLLAVLYSRERQPTRAIPLLNSLAEKFPMNNLFRFEQVQMYSEAGDKKAAADVIAAIERLRRSAAPGFNDVPAAKVQFVAGNLHFWYGDIGTALGDLQQATRNSRQLDLNMAVLAWLRLGQVYDLQGAHEQAVTAYRETMKTAPDSDAASEAKGYISSPYRRKKKDDNRG